MAKKSKWLVPLTIDGSLIHNSYNAENTKDEVRWIENYEFEDTLRILRLNSDYCSVVSETNKAQYQIFHSDIMDLISNMLIDHGVLTGKWTFVKRGSRYGIVRVT